MLIHLNRDSNVYSFDDLGHLPQLLNYDITMQINSIISNRNNRITYYLQPMAPHKRKILYFCEPKLNARVNHPIVNYMRCKTKLQTTLAESRGSYSRDFYCAQYLFSLQRMNKLTDKQSMIQMLFFLSIFGVYYTV